MENKNFLNSLRIAFFGIKCALEKEKNFRIMFLIAVIVVVLMIVLDLSTVEKSILLLTIFVILSLELINSQIEKILDFIQPELHQKVKTIKDLSAGAVMLSSLGSIVLGIIIFLPRIIDLIEGR